MKECKNRNFGFIFSLGTVSFFSDMMYEGARSIIGPFLALLGASGAVVGFVAGFGEAIAYFLRIGSGYLVDRTKQYWLIAFVGYICNFIAIPLLGFAGNWQSAAALIIFERVGKAIRTPARDTMLSYASQRIGRGWGFGLHQVMDQIGGVFGPLMVTLILFYDGDYRHAFMFLAIPGMMMLLSFFVARHQFPHPQLMEIDKSEQNSAKLPTLFWLYLLGASLLAAGYVDFPIIAYHFQKADLFAPIWIPIYFIIAMLASAVSALLLGWLYDYYGVAVLMLATIISACSAPLVFLGHTYMIVGGMIAWGIGMGAQRSLLKAVVGDLVMKSIRGTAYGIFNSGYGVAWFLGSWLIGYLYDVSVITLVCFSAGTQLGSIFIIFAVHSRLRNINAS